MNKMYVSLITVFLIFSAFTSLSAQSLVDDLNAGENEAALKGRIMDPNKIPEKGLAYVIKSEDGSFIRKGVTDIDGKFELVVPKGKRYKVVVNKMDMEHTFISNVPNDKGPMEVVQDYVIKFIFNFNRTYGLENVYFDTDKWDLREDAKSALDSLVNTFLLNPMFMAEIAGHTDDQGSDTDNLRLSQRRADAIREYLIEKGVDPNRVFSKGYGETSPIASNDTAEGRKKNRRTEVRIMFE